MLSHSVLSDSATPWTVAHQAPVSMGILQGIFPTQGTNPGLPHCRQIFYQLSHQGSSRILEWVAYPFSRGFSQPRNGTGVSCIAGEFFTSWATKEAPSILTTFIFKQIHKFSSFSIYILYISTFTFIHFSIYIYILYKFLSLSLELVFSRMTYSYNWINTQKGKTKLRFFCIPHTFHGYLSFRIKHVEGRILDKFFKKSGPMKGARK